MGYLIAVVAVVAAFFIGRKSVKNKPAETIKEPNREDFIRANGMSIEIGFRDSDKKRNIIDNLPLTEYQPYISNLPLPDAIEQRPDSGAGICFTGFVEADKERLKEISFKLGMIPKSTVSKKVSLLVYGDTPGSVKINRAQELGIEIISLNDFLKRYSLV